MEAENLYITFAYSPVYLKKKSVFLIISNVA